MISSARSIYVESNGARTLRGIGVGSTIPCYLVEPAESGEFDTTMTNLDLLCDDPWESILGRIEVVDEWVVEVVGSRA